MGAEVLMVRGLGVQSFLSSLGGVQQHLTEKSCRALSSGRIIVLTGLKRQNWTEQVLGLDVQRREHGYIQTDELQSSGRSREQTVRTRRQLRDVLFQFNMVEVLPRLHSSFLG